MTDLLGPASTNAVTVRPADDRTIGGDDTFCRDCTSSSAQDGTQIKAAWLNALMQQIRRAIRGMGVTENNADDDMLLKAIRAASNSAVTTAATKQPIYPEITNAGNVFAFSNPAGTLILNSSQTWQHRGLLAYSSSQFDIALRTFATAANTTYHLRWYAPGHANAPAGTYPLGRFMLRSIADVAYNPSAKAEADASFDATYDDMLCARVVTNAGNALAVTPLANKAALQATFTKDVFNSNDISVGGWTGLPGLNATLNWARTPQWMVQNFTSEVSNVLDMVNALITTVDRYDAYAFLACYSNSPTYAYTSGKLKMEARA